VLAPVTTAHYLVLSTILLFIGVVGILTRRNVIVLMMSIEIILNAVNVNLIAFARNLDQVEGQVFAIFVICVAVAEAAVGWASSSRCSATRRRCMSTRSTC
jgi:NADH-quinone oxidoreductase subunit K